MTRDDHPGSLGAVHTGEIGLEPCSLGVHCRVEGSTVFALDTAWFIGSREPVAQVGLGVDLDEVRHAVVE